MGKLYGTGRLVAKDEALAVHFFQLAANQGDAAALKELGLCYLRGQGVAKDEVKANELFRLSAAQGDAIDNLDSISSDLIDAIRKLR